MSEVFALVSAIPTVFACSMKFTKCYFQHISIPSTIYYLTVWHCFLVVVFFGGVTQQFCNLQSKLLKG